MACFQEDQTSKPIQNYITGTLTPSKGPRALLNRIALPNSTTARCARKIWNSQYVGEVQTTRNEIAPPFRQTIIYVILQVLQAEQCLQSLRFYNFTFLISPNIYCWISNLTGKKVFFFPKLRENHLCQGLFFSKTASSAQFCYKPS